MPFLDPHNLHYCIPNSHQQFSIDRIAYVFRIEYQESFQFYQLNMLLYQALSILSLQNDFQVNYRYSSKHMLLSLNLQILEVIKFFIIRKKYWIFELIAVHFVEAKMIIICISVLWLSWSVW